MYDQEVSDSDDETDEPSSTKSTKTHVDDVLASFREKWQQELRASTAKKRVEVAPDAEEALELEQKATMWYLKGAELERSGIFYEAIQCYRKAVQLVPHVEKLVFNQSTPKEKSTTTSIAKNANLEETFIDGALLQHIQRKMAPGAASCAPDYEQRALHVSSLPTEILLYIFKWVVSRDLDLRSLEVCAMVCRGFYLVARDSEIWKLACGRVWGATCGLQAPFGTWREMYVQRARLHYGGCYISKTTYIRHGENSFQDQFYRPWHLVCYYRYLRFFPDGVVLMLTTPDEPQQCVQLLRHRSAKHVLVGHYRLKDDRVVLVVQDQNIGGKGKKTKAGKKWQIEYENGEQTFHLEFQIMNAGTKRKNMQLVWKYYAVLVKNRNGGENKSTFEIANNRFPSLWFSRVKSYTKETHFPLI